MILPGTAYDFPVIFKSNGHGIFMEEWNFVTSPSATENKIILQVFAYYDDLGCRH